MTDEDYLTRRRRFLIAGTAATIGALAGCSSNSGGENATTTSTPTQTITTSQGPAQFRVQLSAPTEARVGQSFRFTLEIANTGGQSGRFSYELHTTEGAADISRMIQVDSLGSGERTTVQTNPITLNQADDYVFQLGQVDLTHSISIQPQTVEFGNPIDVSDALRVTIREVAFEPSIFYTVSTYTSQSTDLLSAPSQSVLAIIRATIENTGTESTSVSASSFGAVDGQIYSSLGDGTELSAARISGDPIGDQYQSLNAGAQQSGWLLAQVPQSALSRTLAITYQATSSSFMSDTSGTRPEAQWTTSPSEQLPSFNLGDLSAPDQVVINENSSLSANVTNSGNVSGQFRGVAEYRTNESNGWRPFETINRTVDPGESVNESVRINSSGIRSVEYRVSPFDATRRVEFTSQSFNFGQTYQTQGGVRLTVSNLQQSDSVTLAPAYSGADPEEVTPIPANRYVLVEIRSVVDREVQQTPLDSEIGLMNSEQSFSKAEGVNGDLTAPVESPLYEGTYNPDRGDTYQGYLVFSVPQSVQLGSLTLVWRGDGGETAQWTRS